MHILQKDSEKLAEALHAAQLGDRSKLRRYHLRNLIIFLFVLCVAVVVIVLVFHK